MACAGIAGLPAQAGMYALVISLKALGAELRAAGVQAHLGDVHTPALTSSCAVGVLDVIGEDHVLPTIELAVQHVEGTSRAARQ
jgi:hypothetical protein